MAEVFRLAVPGMCFRIFFSSVLCVALLGGLFKIFSMYQHLFFFLLRALILFVYNVYFVC